MIRHVLSEHHVYRRGVMEAIVRPRLNDFHGILLLVGNFRLFGNPSDCVHEPIPVEDSNDSFIFEIEVKGPRKLVLAENQMYPA